MQPWLRGCKQLAPATPALAIQRSVFAAVIAGRMTRARASPRKCPIRFLVRLTVFCCPKNIEQPGRKLALQALPHGSSEMTAIGRETRPALLGCISFAREANPPSRNSSVRTCVPSGVTEKFHTWAPRIPPVSPLHASFLSGTTSPMAEGISHSAGFPMKYGPDRNRSGKVGFHNVRIYNWAI